MLTHLSLFSGIGGLDLAAEWAGIETIGQCEWADYPTKVLEKHWPEVPRWRDIRTLNKESFYERTGRRTVDIISGGFPCQPFSVAGKQRGKEDDRYLWPEMVRVIKELRPTWVIGENVAGIIRMALSDILSKLEVCGYRTRTFLIPAAGVGARHRRYRVAIVAHADNRSGDVWRNREFHTTEEVRGEWSNHRDGEKEYESGEWGTAQSVLGRMADGISGRLDRDFLIHHYWDIEPGIPRVESGIEHRVDRLKCLGNAVVPQQFYPIFQAIAEIERRSNE